MRNQTRKERRIRRHRRVRAKAAGSAKRPRLSVFFSHKHMYAQLIDDGKGKTVLSLSDFSLKGKMKKKPVDAANDLGILLAKKAAEKKIARAVFDRGGYRFHGKVKAFAEGAKEGGLRFS